MQTSLPKTVTDYILLRAVTLMYLDKLIYLTQTYSHKKLQCKYFINIALYKAFQAIYLDYFSSVNNV